MRRYFPKVGEVFKDRKELVERLEETGWKFEGQGASMSPRTGKVTGYDVGVIDSEKDLWLMIDLKPYRGKVKVTKVRRLKLSDYGKSKARKDN